ncbi:MAG: hypothetical protein APF82_01950 [Sphingomonadales bacterium BRH_c42]|nr:MAG: hypothetical protein APF82_01950 [Sphingomonadales bacterium BRH_c42]
MDASFVVFMFNSLFWVGRPQFLYHAAMRPLRRQGSRAPSTNIFPNAAPKMILNKEVHIFAFFLPDS